MAESREKLSKILDDVLVLVTEKNKLKPTPEQKRAINSFLNGRDTFVSLPTGHGKSLIFQLAIPIVQLLHEIDEELGSQHFPKNPLLIVVAPLQALMKDQILSCEKFGLKAAKLEELDRLLEYSGQIIFTSPEMLANHLSAIKDIHKRIIGVVVDESHCVVNWGTADSGKSPFRVEYSNVGNIRAIVKAPVLCLTATASRKTRKKIIQMLHMEKTQLVFNSPDKKNIKYTVEKADNNGDLENTFSWLIKDLIDNALDTKKTIIFCTSFKECGDIYDTLLQCLPKSHLNHIAMYHARTPERIKENVLMEIVKTNSQIRLVIATSALGMGVNIPDIGRIVHYGVPEDIESYVQAIGRGGRDGRNVLSVLYYRNYHLCHCDVKMRDFVKNSDQCRRLGILKFFGVKGKTSSVLHDCCDVCAKKCKCGSCPSVIDKSFKCDQLSEKQNELSRQVSPEQRDTFISVLRDIKMDHIGKASVMGSKFLENMLEDETIEELGKNLEHLFTMEYIMENFPILERQVATEILTVVDDLFEDIQAVQDFKDISTINWDDFYFPDIPESCYSSDDSL